MAQPAPLRVRVVEVIEETHDACSLVLEPVTHPERFTYKPGQFLTIRVPATRGDGAARCYSLCGCPQRGEPLKVTVKRTEGGYGSNWLCDNAVPGCTLDVLRPAGTFTPRSLDADLLLLAGGSGVTPVMSILKSCLYAGAGSVTLIYANRDERSVIFHEELAALARRYPARLTVVHWLESVQGRPTEDTLRALLAPLADREAFVCGPEPFMDLTLSALAGLGTPPARVHAERFTVPAGDPFAAPDVEPDASGPSSTVEVRLDGATHTVSWPRHAKLLDVLLAAGLDAPFSCREGACSACACVLLDGEVTLAHNEVLEDQDLADGLILACQALPRTDRLTVSYDE